LRAAGAFLGFALLTTIWAVVSSWELVDNAPPEVRPTLLVNAALGPVAIGGVALSICLALAIARRSYRLAVRPLLFARAPTAPGAPVRCRACGGPLPDRRDALVQCAYCNTQNLVTEELLQNRTELLQQEHRFYQDRGNRILAATTRKLPNTQRVFVVSCLLVYGVIIALGALANALLPS
jgi:hypothetical protein